MKKFVLVWIFCGMAAGTWVSAAEENTDVEALKREVRELRELTQKLQRRLEALEAPPTAASPAAPTAQPKAAGEKPMVRTEASPAPEPAAVKPAWSPTQPIPVFRSGGTYMNMGFDAMMDLGGSTESNPAARLNLGDHDPIQRGFSMRNAEIALDGAVDPYFTGFANIVLKLDRNGGTEIEAEEVYAKTTALPGGLQLKAGQFFANFGKQNPQHPHQWAFVDQPLILSRVFGPEGLRSLGAEAEWLAPTPFFSELTLGVFNGNGDQGFLFRNPGGDDGAGVNRFRGRATFARDLGGPEDLLFVPRYSASFDLTDNQTLLLGTSAAFGPNDTGPDTRTEVYGVDAFWKWKSPTAHMGFPFVILQTEGLASRFEAGSDPSAGLPRETLWDYGFYSQALWGFKERWVLGLRGEWTEGTAGLADAADAFRNPRVRISPNITWYMSEFSKVRLQYNFDQGDLFGTAHSVWLQFEFQLGAHAPHKF